MIKIKNIFICIQNIFNKGNNNKLCYIDVDRADAFILQLPLYHIAIQKGEENRNSDRVQ